MSDLLVIRGMNAEPANRLLEQWAQSRPWARSAEVHQRWEPGELEINGHNAMKFMRGKHKQELAELILLLERAGARVVHVMLRDDHRAEEDLGEWASRETNRGSGSGRAV
jgi:hypothetical protein